MIKICSTIILLSFLGVANYQFRLNDLHVQSYKKPQIASFNNTYLSNSCVHPMKLGILERDYKDLYFVGDTILTWGTEGDHVRCVKITDEKRIIPIFSEYKTKVKTILIHKSYFSKFFRKCGGEVRRGHPSLDNIEIVFIPYTYETISFDDLN